MITRKFKEILFLVIFFCNISLQAQVVENFESSSTKLNIVGRGNCRIENGVFKSKDSYACFGNTDLKDYTVSFKARAPKDAEQVQIWAGFRAYNRFDRYVLGLKGGLQDDIYLSRMGYMGADELLDIRPIDFHPIPGQWYKFKIEVCGNRIRVFLNDETLPRIDVIDKNSNLAPSGSVTLGGGWIETEFDDLQITPFSSKALDGVLNKVYEVKVSPQEKEVERKKMRAAYKPVVIDKINQGRTEISLQGNWLFLPDYESKDIEEQTNPNIGDNQWHIMNVPDFWNPIRIWLHGETMNPNRSPKGVSDTYFQKETARCESYTFDYKKTKAAWYRQWIELPADIENKKTELVFDAVSKMADIYVNGKLITKHIGMFGEIKADCSGIIKPGKNLISVLVTRDYIKNIEDADKIVDVAVTVPVTNKMLKDIAHGFYGDDPAGIWQPVALIITNPVKVEDVFIQPSLNGAKFEVTISNNSNKKVKFDLLTNIVECKTSNIFHSEKSLNNIEMKGGETKLLSFSINNLRPRLWTPQSPNLYDFKFTVTNENGKEDDAVTIRSGFRTFEVKNGLLYLNGIPYWLRGGNHTPFALAPNDKTLANSFYQIMKAGNIDVTRTHTTPYNKLWIDAADENGIGISHEGTWPWLMIHGSMPDISLIELWADEYISLLKKYRNHPSILFWTINNEMKFSDNEPDLEKRKMKMKIISDVVERMRKIDPTRPICFDSNYRRREDIFGKDFFKNIDDGDIDDIHSYINWYDHTVFKEFKGEFQKQNRNEGRPLISQEMSTGYPNNETGHATRFYTLVHQNPQTLIGYQAYAFGNPDSFLKVQSFITGELAEALRRSNDKASGILHFALLTWFRNVYDTKTIEPYPTYYAMQRALQPVLASAEIWGRNFYAGQDLAARFCIVNDLEDGHNLKAGVINWTLETESGQILTKGKTDIPEVNHYKRAWVTPTIQIPENLPAEKINAKLKLRYTEEGKQMSINEYDILLAQPNWTQSVVNGKNIVLVDYNNTAKALDFIKVKYTKVNSITDALKIKADLIILASLDKNTNTSDLKEIRTYIFKGGRALILNSENASKEMFAEYITDWIIPTEGDIVNMEIPESSVFNDIELLELRYFNNYKSEVPTVCHSAFKVNRSQNVEELANQTKIHGYINGEMEERSDYVKTIKGFPILKIKDNKGSAMVSTMSHEKTETDPIAARLLANMINNMLE
ncbi:glycoside hydrolase family 2 [Dysgonomonas sp. HGC4]|uniref:glycoside hydrolase family 2 n=1 Tax=Dysgonomonas sp. HGC4 TaxID=1658009 RepID=UPI000682D519|nr:glycoside hydrolase family 2 [Dysgonomonas sp. HGC4]MBD8347870.1 glycoside hydrolase family 2 [Dysgonomonas sp. HGC4]